MLDKARFEFFPLGKTFSTGLDKTAHGYQEKGVIKLLKDIRDGLAGGIVPERPRRQGAPERPGINRPDDEDDDDDDDDDDDEQKRLSKLLGELRTNEDNEEFRNEPKEDKLDKFVNDNDNDNMPDLETEEEAVKRNILNKINNFDEMVRNKEDEFDKMFKDKKNRLNKLNNNVKRIKKYIKVNNDEIIVMKNKLYYTENERNNLLLNINQLYNELKETKNELKELDNKRELINEYEAELSTRNTKRIK